MSHIFSLTEEKTFVADMFFMDDFLSQLPPPDLPEAGWYADPDDPKKKRYWSGKKWTEHWRMLPSQPAPPQVGWYADPDDMTKLRYRDGLKWTDKRQNIPSKSLLFSPTAIHLRTAVALITIFFGLILIITGIEGEPPAYHLSGYSIGFGIIIIIPSIYVIISSVKRIKSKKL